MKTMRFTRGNGLLTEPANRLPTGGPSASRSLIHAIVLACSLSVAACSSTKDAQVRPASIVDFKPTPAQVLEAGDDLEIKFRYTPELDQRQTIRPDGTVSMPLIGDVAAAGLTESQLRQTLLDQYATQLRAPELMVVVRSQPSNQLYVAGEVNKEGPQPATPVLTVSQAIITAQGLKTTAHPGEVLVIRTGQDQAREVRSVDMTSILEGEAAAQDVKLQAGDIVYVPKSFIADANTFVEQYIRGMLPISPTVAFVP